MEFITIKSKMFDNEVFKLVYFLIIIAITKLIPLSIMIEWLIFTWGVYTAYAYITSKKTLRMIEQSLEAKDKEK